jgi:anaerobic ribonucleoside-triphosphate reductase
MNIQITGNVSTEEQMAYVDYLESKYNRKLKSLSINADGEFADLNYQFEPVPFDRIRRITGYLVGTMDKWNNAKYSEEHDRVKHDIGTGLEQL